MKVFFDTNVLLDAFYIVKQLKGRQVAQHAIVRIRDVFEPVAADKQLVHKAIDAGFSDFEDAIQFFSALGAGAACLVTRNKAHFPTDRMPVQTPAEFLAAHFAAEKWE